MAALIFVIVFWGVVIYFGIRIFRKAAASIPSEEATVGSPAGAWSRYFARLFDLLIETSVLATALLLVMPLPDFSQASTNKVAASFIEGLVYTPPALFLDAACMALLGNTLGKRMFGIKVVPKGGGKLSFGEAIGRNFRMWLFGLALGLAPFSLFTGWINYRKVKAGKLVSWDKPRHNNVVQSASEMRIAIGIVVSALALAMALVLPIVADELSK